MKKSLIALAALGAVSASLAVALPAMAQPGFGYGHGPNPEYMARVLDLTPEQQAKVKALFDEQVQRRAQLRTTMRTEMQTKLQGILTKEQYAKMQDLRQLRWESRQAMGPGRGGRGPGNGPGTGPGSRPDCPGIGPMGPRAQ